MGVIYLPVNLLFPSELPGRIAYLPFGTTPILSSQSCLTQKKNGWEVKKHESDEKYFTLNWFEGEMLPKKLDDILLETSNDEEEQEEDLEEQIDNESDEEENAEEEAAEEDDLRADDD